MTARRSPREDPSRRGPARDAQGRTSRDKPRTPPPTSVDEALGRARVHARNAVAEALAAARALLDAAALASSGRSADSHRALGTIARGLDDLSEAAADGGGALSAPVVNAILEALDSEIARWEVRSREDADARAVLRAFLGLREILWEFGLRSATGTAPPTARAARAPRRRTGARRGAATAARPAAKSSEADEGDESDLEPPPRIQRVEIQ